MSIIYETPDLRFEREDGVIVVNRKHGKASINHEEIQTHLLLDIVMTLQEIHCWGIALERDGGQLVQDYR